MVEELCDLGRRQVLNVERRLVSHCNNGIIEVCLDELSGLVCEFSARRVGRDDGSSEDESLKRSEVDALAKAQ